MSYADQVFIENCRAILSRGVWDTDREVPLGGWHARPHGEALWGGQPL